LAAQVIPDRRIACAMGADPIKINLSCCFLSIE